MNPHRGRRRRNPGGSRTPGRRCHTGGGTPAPVRQIPWRVRAATDARTTVDNPRAIAPSARTPLSPSAEVELSGALQTLVACKTLTARPVSSAAWFGPDRLARAAHPDEHNLCATEI